MTRSTAFYKHIEQNQSSSCRAFSPRQWRWNHLVRPSRCTHLIVFTLDDSIVQTGTSHFSSVDAAPKRNMRTCTCTCICTRVRVGRQQAFPKGYIPTCTNLPSVPGLDLSPDVASVPSCSLAAVSGHSRDRLRRGRSTQYCRSNFQSWQHHTHAKGIRKLHFMYYHSLPGSLWTVKALWHLKVWMAVSDWKWGRAIVKYTEITYCTNLSSWMLAPALFLTASSFSAFLSFILFNFWSASSHFRLSFSFNIVMWSALVSTRAPEFFCAVVFL